ncbi:site-specific integrase [Rhizobium leguminosarum bv. viciae]|uniref:site-specific integrase n=1 Tax=Rhizobium TaxID=379 RepID=UPI00103E0BF5|nr:site-specific integrase [Rhizobium leguminosarum]TBZ67878.1 site-specific integrase [Rhizobium leguminosarum bv. viciae]
MGTISERTRKNGTKAYTAQIRLKQKGEVVHSEAQTFDRKPAAKAWLKKRETELAEPGALEKLKVEDPMLADVIDEYISTSIKAMGKTKAQCLRLIKKHPIASRRCSTIASPHLSAFAKDLQSGWLPEGEEDVFEAAVDKGDKKIVIRQPQTVGNYMSHLGSVFAVARPMWGYQLDQSAFEDAVTVTSRLGIISRSQERDRRPTIAELERLLAFFVERRKRTPQSSPMDKIILFAIFSTRRQEEITVIRWSDYEPGHDRYLVRDMKHPGQKIGNDVWCTLLPEGRAIIESMPRGKNEIFPYNPSTISRNFTDACKLLGIEDLHFHDLRHDGISRLFEMGWDIPRAATVSAHRSWSSLKRYTHIRQVGDKYAGWKWLPQTGTK